MSSENKIDASTVPLPVIKVLMIDDDPYYCRFTKELLSRQENCLFEISTVHTMDEATDAIELEPPHIVVLDLNLRETQGLSTLDKLGDLAISCPILVLTGIDSESLGLEALSRGAQDYLVKQFITKDSLVRSIRYAVERHKSEEQRLRMAAIQDFTAMLAHDLKVPVLGSEKVLEALLAKQLGDLNETQLSVLQSLRDSTQKQLQLINKLLEIYKYETNALKLVLRPLEPLKLLTKCVRQITNNLNVEIQIDRANLPANLSIVGDPEALEQLFANLLDNAIKYGDGLSPITIKLHNYQDKLSIDFHNTGPTLPEGIQKTLFRKFWQGIPGKTYVANTGLGLYLCHRIAQLHSGNLTCKSSEEEGTTLSLKIPVVKEQATKASAPKESRESI
ncbi:MAG TPA: hybrid sensor histidine kinase/response regulator [Candidatus Obscuribacter sp.]|nr:hybrid sensor histidine kinase/response regulator [Candidatus Obscuribacter sp.]HMX44842.1 hybrid sensor histidine kinase/response regulator [Candidatus Obscuribacter sp.]